MTIPSPSFARRLVGSVWLAGMLLAAPVAAQPAPALVDSLGQRLVQGHPGGAVIGLLHGTGEAVHAFGAVDSTGPRPTARTLFEIGSITKTFTGLLLAQAVEERRLQPSAPIRPLLPDSVVLSVADSVRRASPDSTVTLLHLATHRSGLPRLPANLRAEANPWDPYAAYGDSALYAFLDGYELPRAPGTAYAYSNIGAGLLGHLLARRADTNYAALVHERIAEPLGLCDTRIRLSPVQDRRFAQGHNRAGAPTSPWHFDALAGAGALRSTAADLLAYLRAHRRVLREEADPAGPPVLKRAMRRALRPRAPTAQDSTRIGYAWHQTRRSGHRVLWHNGGTGGFRSFVGIDRSTGHGAVVLVSAAVSSELVADAGFGLIEALRRGGAPSD